MAVDRYNRGIQEIMEGGKIGEDFAKGVATLIFKKGKEDVLVNWMPMTLLNVHYKLIVKVLAKRTCECLADVIQEKQMCVIPERRVFQTLWLRREVILDMEERKINTVRMNLNQEKAYNKVEHDFMSEVLQRMGFPAKMIVQIKVLYSKVGSQVLVNDYLSKAFPKQQQDKDTHCPPIFLYT